MLEFKGFEGHIILLCKGHYATNNVDILTGLRRIWAIRCGYEYIEEDKSADIFIANKLYLIIQKSLPNKTNYFHEIIHSEIMKPWYDGYNILEKLIILYKSEISQLQVKENNDFLIKLPKPQKRIFKRIIRGNGRFNDYELINK